MELAPKIILLVTLLGSAAVIAFFVVQSHGFNDAKPRVAAALAEVAPSGPPENHATVTRVINGHSFAANIGGSSQVVRMVGIDTPILAEGDQPSGCYGIESADKLRALIQGKQVKLTPDPSQTGKDQNGRLLRYVSTTDDQDIGRQMIELGLAKEYTYHSYPHPKQQEYQEAQGLAVRAVAGLWSPTTCGGDFFKVNPGFVARAVPDPKIDPKTISCARFKTRFDALRFYEYNGGPFHDWYHLDLQHNGKPCDNLP